MKNIAYTNGTLVSDNLGLFTLTLFNNLVQVYTSTETKNSAKKILSTYKNIISL